MGWLGIEPRERKNVTGWFTGCCHAWPPGISPNPGGKSKRIPELFAQMSIGLGDLTGIERTLLWQAARLMAKSERAPKANDQVRLANAAARLLASLRRDKRKQGPSLLNQALRTGIAQQEPVR
jgi:hypothetical protein